MICEWKAAIPLTLDAVIVNEVPSLCTYLGKHFAGYLLLVWLQLSTLYIEERYIFLALNSKKVTITQITLQHTAYKPSR